MKPDERYEVIVVGGGHAGTEAALAAARLGCRTLLVTHSIDTLGQMSCNPAIGGIGKGHIVREVDALGGAMARAIDRAGIQFRRLNARKGPAVRATRAQADRVLYRRQVRAMLEAEPGLDLFQAEVEDILLAGARVRGVRTHTGIVLEAARVVLTAGTFLAGTMHVGLQASRGGRAGEAPSDRLADRLRELAPAVGRLKTGTPPRLDGRTIDFDTLEEQPGDRPAPVFSFLGDPAEHPRQVSCHITYTNARTHEIIRAGLDRSPIYGGVIDAVGPRYCPSVEDKVVRFADKNAHQIFVEPEGLDTREIYPNGISSSLPFEVQREMVRSIAGFENARITRPGYAIEYDYFDPRDLRPWLETRAVEGLYFAGQINGTTGYEEAAGQGLVAGANAALAATDREPWWPGRDEAYIGVLIDDLVTNGTEEPYRMFTSRAEYRLQLREDNADARLTETARRLGLVDDVRWEAYARKRDLLEHERDRLHRTWLRPNDAAAAAAERVLGQPLAREARLYDLLRRPEVGYEALVSLPGLGPGVADAAVAERLEIEAGYDGYIERQAQEIEARRAGEELVLPADLDYAAVRGLSTEVRQKLERIRPETVGQAARISGVTPAAISVLLVHLKKRAGGAATLPRAV